ncbi:hypothetical protein RhiirA1_402265 [Rhizophagus irregularis]|uniref:Uncharacterized protein n=1 Tax=Rhizophagus irregularis TaxID=588596 RepID=A0A2N0QYY4_9GLOM|nr:hypothetical protein RhiirA1_402265 [Rhizophagus irregularis]
MRDINIPFTRVLFEKSTSLLGLLLRSIKTKIWLKRYEEVVEIERKRGIGKKIREVDLDNEEPPNKSLQSPLSSKNTNLATTAHEIRRKVMEVFAPDWNNLEDEA